MPTAIMSTVHARTVHKKACRARGVGAAGKLTRRAQRAAGPKSRSGTEPAMTW